MSDSESTKWTDSRGLESPHANQPEDTLEHSHIKNPDAPDRVMQTPHDAEGEEFLTMWISARADALIDLEGAR